MSSKFFFQYTSGVKDLYVQRMCRDSCHLVVPWVLEICDYLYFKRHQKKSGKNADTSW